MNPASPDVLTQALLVTRAPAREGPEDRPPEPSLRLGRKLRGLPEKTEEDEEDENAQQQGAEEGAPSAVETLFENEAHRLEMMLDQTVMSEERRLRAMLVSGTCFPRPPS